MNQQPITKKQLQILNLLYKFRYVTVQQLQKLFHHKDPHRVKDWLKDLKEKRYISVIIDEKDITKPYIYCLHTKAKYKLLENEDYDSVFLNRLYKEKSYSQNFINHCLFIVDIYLYYLARIKNDEELHFLTQQDLINYDFFPEELPDVYISIESKEETNIYFLDLFDKYRENSKYAPINVIRKYLDYCSDGAWQVGTNSTTFPTIRFVLQNDLRKMHIFHYGKAKLEKTYEDFLLELTTQDAIRYSSEKTNIWLKI